MVEVEEVEVVMKARKVEVAMYCTGARKVEVVMKARKVEVARKMEVYVG